MRKLVLSTAGVAVALVTYGATIPAEATPPPHYDVVASNLDNPRQLTFSPNGALYVAEAGRGGDGPCMTGGEGSTVCFGDSGAVTRVHHGQQARVLTGLPSLGDESDGSSALGPADLSVPGNNRLVLSIGLGTDPANRGSLPSPGEQMGTLRMFHLKRGTSRTLADLAAFEAHANPVDNPDSDPTGILRVGDDYLTTDSGGNTLVRSSEKGKVRLVAAFPDVTAGTTTYQAVPTDVVRGPDGAWYVSQLTGFPFIPGAANIYRIVPGHAPTVYASGLTNVTGLAFDHHGMLYAVQIADQGLLNGPVGSLVRVAPDGSGQTTESVASGLFAPYGVAIRRGSAYVTTCSVCAGDGQVLRIPLG